MAETPAAENRLLPHQTVIFAKNIDLVGQQKQSHLVNHVSADLAFNERGDRYTDDMMGLSDPEEVFEDIRPTPGGKVAKFRRQAFFKTFNDGKWVGTREKAEQLLDPTNPVIMAMGFGRERRRDKTIVKSFFDPAYEVDKDGDIVRKNFPGGQVINVNDWTYWKGKADGGGSAPTSDAVLTVPKLRKAAVLASKAQLDGEWCIGVEEEDMQNLLTSTEVASSDYNAVQALVNRERNRFLNFTFVWLEAGTVPWNAGTTTATLPVWNKMNQLYKERPLVTTRVQERADMSYRWHAFYEAQDSWLRREDKGVIHILAKR